MIDPGGAQHPLAVYNPFYMHRPSSYIYNAPPIPYNKRPYLLDYWIQYDLLVHLRVYTQHIMADYTMFVCGHWLHWLGARGTNRRGISPQGTACKYHTSWHLV